MGDADTFLGAELPALVAWRFTREDARRIDQPVLAVLGAESATLWPGWPEVHARLQEWLPQAEPFVLPGREPRAGVHEPPRGRRGAGGVLRPPPHPIAGARPGASHSRSALTALSQRGARPPLTR